MKEPKSLNFLAIVSILLVTGVLMSNMTNKPLISSSAPPSQIAFEQNPPYPVKYWVQKLATPTPKGENLIFKVKYVSDSRLPTTIDLYGNAVSVQYTLKDDGVYPDDVSGDGKYACLKKENITNFLAEINTLTSKIQNNGYAVRFKGHSGEIKRFSEITPFNQDLFNGNSEVEIDAMLIEAELCSQDIRPEKSLFITDLSVVEDQSRTYNVFTGVGTPNGIWTFGTLMANMENGYHADGIRGFLKDWIKQWTTDQSVNGQTVKARKHVLECLITPWLRKAQGNSSLAVTLQNWETLWNATNSNALKQNAPFKLSTIVNRIDLMGNSAYNESFANSGETRFIFSLIDPYTGNISMNPDQRDSRQTTGGFGDWRGMNVILEFGNVQTSKCSLLALAQEWLDLSDGTLSFGTANTNNSYKNALQHITDYVTVAGANTGKINGSAINRIRTNEKAFADGDLGITDHIQRWARQDWEFRQFELDPTTHAFKLVPLTNNPPISSNAAINIDEDFSGSQVVLNEVLLDWIYNGNKLKVQQGNFNMPSFLLAKTAVVTSEAAHYYDFRREYWTGKSTEYNAALSSSEAKEIRQQFSLNTCIGCHNGETKTRFMQINTLAYNEPAKYWLSGLDGNNVEQDVGSYPFGIQSSEMGGYNQGGTVDPNFGGFNNYRVDDEFESENFFQAVSPFLIGRRYRTFTAASGKQPSSQDDERDDANVDGDFWEINDNSTQGLFYVMDPSNDGSFPHLNGQKWGYNDLLRRKKRLCNFIVNGCTGILGEQNNPSAITLIRSIAFIPLPLAGH